MLAVLTLLESNASQDIVLSNLVTGGADIFIQRSSLGQLVIAVFLKYRGLPIKYFEI